MQNDRFGAYPSRGQWASYLSVNVYSGLGFWNFQDRPLIIQLCRLLKIFGKYNRFIYVYIHPHKKPQPFTKPKTQSSWRHHTHTRLINTRRDGSPPHITPNRPTIWSWSVQRPPNSRAIIYTMIIWPKFALALYKIKLVRARCWLAARWCPIYRAAHIARITRSHLSLWIMI